MLTKYSNLLFNKNDRVRKTPNLRYYIAAAVSIATFIIYLTSISNDFVYWDDEDYVFNNPHIRSLDENLFRWAFHEFYSFNWHPLTWISHAIDYAIWGLNPLGHHLTNVILHAVNTFVVVILVVGLLRVLTQTRINNGQSEFLDDRTILIAGGVTGLLFGLHPMHVESVAWVSERKDVLSALFFLLSIIVYAKYASNVHRDTAQNHPLSRLFNKYYLLALGSFILALLSKPMAVTLPFVLLILDWYPFKRIQSLKMLRDALIEKLPFIALSCVSSLLTILAQEAGGAIISMETVPLAARVLVAIRSLILYLWTMLWPLNLIPYYPYPTNVSLLSLEYLSAIAMVIGISAACVVSAQKQKIWLAVWGYFVITLIPVIGIVQVGGQAMADRYTYLPSLGPFLLIGVAVAWIAKKINALEKWKLLIKGGAIAAFVLIAASLLYLTIRQIAIWKDTDELMSYVIEKGIQQGFSRSLFHAYSTRGVYLIDIGQLDKAIADFDEAITLEPNNCRPYYYRGEAFYRMGKFDMAVADYEKAIALYPPYWQAYVGRDQALHELRQRDKSRP